VNTAPRQTLNLPRTPMHHHLPSFPALTILRSRRKGPHAWAGRRTRNVSTTPPRKNCRTIRHRCWRRSSANVPARVFPTGTFRRRGGVTPSLELRAATQDCRDRTGEASRRGTCERNVGGRRSWNRNRRGAKWKCRVRGVVAAGRPRGGR
jgi:hypothetical protein